MDEPVKSWTEEQVQAWLESAFGPGTGEWPISLTDPGLAVYVQSLRCREDALRHEAARLKTELAAAQLRAGDLEQARNRAARAEGLLNERIAQLDEAEERIQALERVILNMTIATHGKA